MTSPKKDIVIAEIPVCLTKAYDGKVYLLQQPLKPAFGKLNMDEVVSVRVKPQQLRLQIGLDIDKDSKYYDKSREGEFTQGSDNKKSRGLETRYLEATQFPKLSKCPRYVMLLVKEEKIQLVHLADILQLRPSFKYLDTKDNKEEDDDDEDAIEAQKVTVKFSRGQPATRGAKHQAYTRKRDEEEPWVDLDFDHQTNLIKETLFTHCSDNKTPFYVLSRLNYLELLFKKQTDLGRKVIKKEVDPDA